MNKMIYLGCVALASCIGMSLGYGSVMTGQKVTGFPYMANMGYGYVPYMTGSSGFGGFLGGTGSSAGGMGLFGNIIQCLGSGGLGMGKKVSHAGSDYDH